MKVSEVIERFEKNTALRFKEGGRTRAVYGGIFRRFARDVGLERYSRRKLAGKAGREVLLAHIAKVSVRSRRVALAALQAVWEEGIELAWPVRKKRDIGKAALPPVGRRETPVDSKVKTWADVLPREPDLWTRLILRMLMQFGWRPENQLGRLPRRTIKFDDAGMPVAIVADGAREGFKSSSWIVAWLPPDVRADLSEFLRRTPEGGPESPIIPARPYEARFDWGKHLDAKGVRMLFRRIESRYGLPRLRPVDMRHFVKSACRRLGLSDPASAAWTGHRVVADASMRNWYDNPGQEALFDEQSSAMPNGPLGVLVAPEVKLEGAFPPEAMELMRAFFAGEISPNDVKSEMEAIRARTVLSTIKP